MVYMSKTDSVWLVARDINGITQVLFETDSFDSAWNVWVSYQK
jgi:hypothetical protein